MGEHLQDRKGGHFQIPYSAEEINLTGDTDGEWVGIRVGTTAGDLEVDMVGEGGAPTTGLTIFNVQVGETVWGQFTKIYSTGNGTTAVGVLGWK